MKYGVYRVKWEESEAGWGIRPDGCSLHATYDEGVQYIKDVMERQRELHGNQVPHEYDRPASSEPAFIEVDEDTAKKVERDRNIRLSKIEEYDLVR